MPSMHAKPSRIKPASARTGPAPVQQRAPSRVAHVVAAPANLHYASSALQRRKAMPAAAPGDGPVQCVWNYDAAEEYWEETDQGYIYDPDTHEWHWGDEDEGLHWAEREVIHADSREALLARFNTAGLREYMDNERVALPGNHEIAQVPDALPGWVPGDSGSDSGSDSGVEEDENISVMAMQGPAAAVGVDFRQHAYTGSYGANTCVIVLMRASDGVRNYGGSIHIAADELDSVRHAALALIRLLEAVGAAMGGLGRMQGLPVCYAIGGENSDDAGDLRDYTTLYNAFETVRGIMTLRGAVLPASAQDGGINASITNDAVRFDRGAQLKRDPHAAQADHGESRDAVVQGWFWSKPKYVRVETLKQRIAQAIKRGAGAYGDVIASRENVDSLLKLFTDPFHGMEAVLNNVLGRDGNFLPWAQSVLGRIEQGARELASDIGYWLTHHFIDHVELDRIQLTGSELHDRGLGVAIATWSYDHGPPAGPAVWRTVLKPDDRSFEQALLGGEHSVAGELNRRAGLKSHRVQTLDMQVSPAHGSMVEYVESGLGQAIQSGLRKLGILHSSQQATTESTAFAFLTGLHDLHEENVKYRGGAPVLIDAEVGLQPDIIDRQYTAGVAISNPGFSNAAVGEGHVEDQLAGRGGSSALLGWAKANPDPDQLGRIIKQKIGDTKARIVPVYTARWFALKNEYLNSLYVDDAQGMGAALNAGSREIPDGGRSPDMEGPGLTRQIGADQGGYYHPGRVEVGIQTLFQQASIPEFNYQPRTGRVFFRDEVIWQGQSIDAAIARLKARLRRA